MRREVKRSVLRLYYSPLHVILPTCSVSSELDFGFFKAMLASVWHKMIFGGKQHKGPFLLRLFVKTCETMGVSILVQMS